jgi:hypothetical protein
MSDVIRRQDLVEADLCCLMCGRMVGRLVGFGWRNAAAGRPTRSMVRLTAFQPLDPDQPSVPLTRQHRFRCEHYGGMAVMEDISVSVVRDEPRSDMGGSANATAARRQRSKDKRVREMGGQFRWPPLSPQSSVLSPQSSVLSVADNCARLFLC